ncbi:enolase C-terminal domain-like protein, partial [Candidatus Latescibacterota bacterium]
KDAQSGGLPTQKGLEVWGEYVEMVRETIGYKVHLGADHFGRMNVETGIGLGKIMAEPQYNLSYIEDVVGFQSQNAINIMKQITAGSPTPTLGYEDIFGLEGFKPFIEEHAVAIIHPDMETSGGLLETRRIADYADLYGIPTMFHCAGSPIGSIAMVHCASTIRNFISQENHALEMPWWEDLVTGIEKPIIQYGGYITVPEKPGLGVELNIEVAKKYLREDKYLAKGGFFEPTPEFDQPMTMSEALDKGYIGGYHVKGPWVHYDDNGELHNFGRSR